MPADVTIFAASKLIFIDLVLAAAVVGFALYRQPRSSAVRWVIAAAVMLVVSVVLAQIGAAIYKDPRPFATDHVKPLIEHAKDNGFPSDHALLGAAIAAAVLLASRWLFAPFALLAAVIDWARVGAGIHHVIDVIGSSFFVAIATILAVLAAPAITARLLPYMPARFRDDRESTETVGARPIGP